jgi:hypothetical protein
MGVGVFRIWRWASIAVGSPPGDIHFHDVERMTAKSVRETGTNFRFDLDQGVAVGRARPT